MRAAALSSGRPQRWGGQCGTCRLTWWTGDEPGLSGHMYRMALARFCGRLGRRGWRAYGRHHDWGGPDMWAVLCWLRVGAVSLDL